MKAWPFVLIGGGLAATAAAFFAHKKSTQVVEAIQDVVNSPPVLPAPPVDQPGSPIFHSKLTGYWPSTATASEQKMEGKPVDRKGAPLHTVEDFLAGKSDHVSVSGDYTIFPYGQKILIPWGNSTITGRVTDTGSHFFGALKVYRIAGREPLDICVLSSSTKIPDSLVDVTIVPGDNYEKGKAVATAGFKNQTVVVGAEDLEKTANVAAKVAAAELLLGLYHDELARGAQ